MKRLGLFVLAIGFIACQHEKKSGNTTDSTNVTTVADTLKFAYDSVKVYSKTPVSAGENEKDTTRAVIAYPVFSDEKINQFIQQKTMASADEGKNYKSYKDYVTDFVKGFDDFSKTEPERSQPWFLKIKTKVIQQKPAYLSLLTTYSNDSGGAHPNSVFTYLNYNPVIHREILLDSLIKPGALPKLTAIGEQIFRKNEKLAPNASLKDNYFFEKDIFKLNNNFTITEKGLKFLYNPYEIKAYVYGTTELIIPFAELKDISRPNSLLTEAN